MITEGPESPRCARTQLLPRRTYPGGHTQPVPAGLTTSGGWHLGRTGTHPRSGSKRVPRGHAHARAEIRFIRG
jgi:hypothetical protein